MKLQKSIHGPDRWEIADSEPQNHEPTNDPGTSIMLLDDLGIREVHCDA